MILIVILGDSKMILKLCNMMALTMMFSLAAAPQPDLQEAPVPCTYKASPCTELYGKCTLTADCSKNSYHPGLKTGDTHEGVCLQKGRHDAELVCKDLI